MKRKAHSLIDKVYSRKNLELAWEKVKRNRGSAGVDEVSIAQFEEHKDHYLEVLHGKLREGTYRPKPVKRVEIPKSDGGKRKLGIPAIFDRVCQQALVQRMEPIFEPKFLDCSFGYRKGRSPHDAMRQVWQELQAGGVWVVDADLRQFFDTIPHDLLLKAVRRHTDCRWVLLYIERWLKAPVQLEDGTLESREKGTPQGSVISPLLANLFLHYAFDRWMAKHHPHIRFERYADDILCHCRSEAQARWLWGVLKQRFAECGLELHPQKTKIVYCKDDDRRGHYPNETFEFLSYSFRPRRSKNRWGKYFVNFSPGVSNAAAKAMRQRIRDWKLRCRVDKGVDDLARMFNPVIRGWITYYGRYYKSALYPTLRYLDRRLAQWAREKYKRLRRHRRRSEHWLRRVARRDLRLFAHWPLLHRAAAGQ